VIAVEAGKTYCSGEIKLSILPNTREFRSSLGSCNQQSKIYSLKFRFGVLAQLVERLNGIDFSVRRFAK
jgi:hypothetical protein